MLFISLETDFVHLTVMHLNKRLIKQNISFESKLCGQSNIDVKLSKKKSVISSTICTYVSANENTHYFSRWYTIRWRLTSNLEDMITH